MRKSARVMPEVVQVTVDDGTGLKSQDSTGVEKVADDTGICTKGIAGDGRELHIEKVRYFRSLSISALSVK